jgi:hypothetical protein
MKERRPTMTAASKRFDLWPIIIALALCSGVLFWAGTNAYASDGEETAALSVENVWLDDNDTLHISVTDGRNGLNQELELNLRDYAGSGDEYVSVQAIDRDGNTSNTIQFKNPYYTASSDAPGASSSAEQEKEPAAQNGAEAGVPDAEGEKPFTPDGVATVVDNANDGDGKEFFSIKTEDENVFYLIVDRQRTADNVYLLNAVTENDLISLAKQGDGIGGGIPAVTPQITPEPTLTAPPEPTLAPAQTSDGGMNGGTFVFIALAALAIGGAGYYLKIVKPRKDAGNADDYGEPEDDESEYDDYSGGADEDGGGDE